MVYDWHSSRAATCLQSILGNSFSGKLQCDGYSAYQRFASDNPSAKLHGCWAHMRRKFYESQEQHPRIVGWILRHIQQLYQWEDQLRTSRAGPNLRHSMRTSHHKLVCQRLFKAFENLSSRILPKSNLGKALNYALNQRESLERVLDAGEVELDNNLVENAIRPTAIGKKNWLFMGSKESGHCSAVVYTLVQSCRMIGVEPSAYLRDVLEHLPTLTNQEIGEWTPMKWALRNGLLKATSRAA
ncbi:MAG: IS66 family transposase [Verrucomicrobiota bacterium]